VGSSASTSSTSPTSNASDRRPLPKTEDTSKKGYLRAAEKAMG
jgi:hypothetical protein